jgi:hypothetical protein
MAGSRVAFSVHALGAFFVGSRTIAGALSSSSPGFLT